MFIDEARIQVRGGKGGNGAVSFRREKYEPKGGPDGGDGGHGGNVIIEVDVGLKTLMDFNYRRHFFAGKGAHGQGSHKTGRRGKDIVLKVPPGTVIKEAYGTVIADLTEPGREVVVAPGGRGGKGNAKFATPANRAPTFAQPGEPGEEKTIELELKLLADVAIVGFPNAGKSTLINRISAAKAKVGDYPFTTRAPNLGAVMLAGFEPFIVADIPGLIEGAHAGKGMGTKFLRHIERVRLLVHLVDLARRDPEEVFRTYRELNNEIVLFNKRLAQLPQIVVGNKKDIISHHDLKAIKLRFKQEGIDIIFISALIDEGVDDVELVTAAKLDSIKKSSEQ